MTKLIRNLLLLLLVGCMGVAAVLYFWAQRNVNLTGWTSEGSEAAVQLQPGFEANIFVSGLNGPRFMAIGPDGVLHAADRGNGRIVALPDRDQDGIADAIIVVASGLNSPHSLTYHNNSWYVGVPSGVVQLIDQDGDGISDEQITLIDDYPTSGHSTRTVLFLPDGRMVVSVGSSCNACVESDPRRAAIVIYDAPPAGGERIYATGLRNAVGLTLHPESGALWASNNGRDLMGDDLPPETIYLVQEGADYGWPFCHNGDIIDPDVGEPDSCNGITPPNVEMQAHSAPLGLNFYTGSSFPAQYQGDLFVAFHGSWNRSVPTGYKVVQIPFGENGLPTGEVIDFAWGWLAEESGEVFGRPTDVIAGSDGALYISDDKAGLIYRISWTGESQ